MRLNQLVASRSQLSRRQADDAIKAGRVSVNTQIAQLGQTVTDSDLVELDSKPLKTTALSYVMLNKPVGVVCSRRGQGAKTVFDLLPPELQNLQTVGRLDKDSSGLLILTNDGPLAQTLTHPSFAKPKSYQVELDRPLEKTDLEHLTNGVQLEDGPSRLLIEGRGRQLEVTLSEGRNRQIRRSFSAFGYNVTKLHRFQFGNLKLSPSLAPGNYAVINREQLS